MDAADKELAELENQINQKNEELKKEPEIQQPEPLPEPIKEDQPVNDPAPEPTESKAKEFDAKEWVKKKGWEKPEDAAESMRALERKLNEQGQELRKLREKEAYQPPENPYSGYQVPEPPPFIPPPAYAPPPPSYAPPRVNEEAIAASYGVTVEDFRRMAALTHDMTEAQNRRFFTDFQKWKADVDKQSQMNADKTSVLADPAFHSPDVQYEMHEILSKNPGMFRNPRHLSEALTQALANIGRKNMTRGYQPPGSQLPKDPPKFGGSGQGTAPGKRTNITSAEFERLDAKEQERYLRSLNAFKTYEDMI